MHSSTRISAPRARTARTLHRPRPAKSSIGKTDLNTSSARHGNGCPAHLHLQEGFVGSPLPSMRFGIGATSGDPEALADPLAPVNDFVIAFMPVLLPFISGPYTPAGGTSRNPRLATQERRRYRTLPATHPCPIELSPPSPPVARRDGGRDHLTSTLAPLSSSTFLILSASSFDTPSLTVLGAPLDQVLGFLEAEAGDGRISLITLIFLSPRRQDHGESVCTSAAGRQRRRQPGPRPRRPAPRVTRPTSPQALGEFGGFQTVRDDSSSTSFARSAMF